MGEQMLLQPQQGREQCFVCAEPDTLDQSIEVGVYGVHGTVAQQQRLSWRIQGAAEGKRLGQSRLHMASTISEMMVHCTNGRTI
jgi:hypothetical protein